MRKRIQGIGYCVLCLCLVPMPTLHAQKSVQEIVRTVNERVVIEGIRYEKEWRNTPLPITIEAHGEDRPLYYALSAQELHWQQDPTFTIQENGTYVFLVNDVPQEAGSVRETIEISCIDVQAPTVVWEPLLDVWSASQTLRVQCEDAQSGLADAPYSFDEGGHWQDTPTLTVSENGRYTVWVRDRAGNVQRAAIDVANIDNQAPTLPLDARIRLQPTIADPSSAIVHHLLFGSYFSSMTVNVPYVDDVSGVALIELFDAKGQLLAQTQGEGVQGEAQLVVAAPTSAHSVALPLFVRIRDHCDNTEMIAVTKENSNLLSLRELLLEAVQPTIQIDQRGGVQDANGRVYDAASLSFVVSLADADAGLQMARVSLNGETLVEKQWRDEQKMQVELPIDLHSIERTEGENRLSVVAMDHAGNRAEQTFLFYRDTTAPTILSVTIDGADALQQQEGYTLFPAAGADLCVQLQDLFADGLAVELTLIDSKGEQSIRRLSADAQGTMLFSLPDGFKGRIAICALDALGNRSDVQMSAWMAVESSTAHAACARTVLSLPQETAWDAQGHPLYAHPIQARLSLTDPHNGIRALSWKWWSKDGTLIDQGELFAATLLGIDGPQADEGGVRWHVLETEENLVLSLQGSFALIAQGNAQRLEVEWEDHGGHRSRQQCSFSIDRTPPQLSCHFADGTQVSGIFAHAQQLVLRAKDANIETDQLQAELIVNDRVWPLQPVWESDGDGLRATVLCAMDGRIQLRLHAKDRAGNQQTLITERFIIDQQAPRWQFLYDPPLSNGYVNHLPIGWLMVEEENFAADGVALFAAAGTKLPAMGRWEPFEGGYRLPLSFLEEGAYRFTVAITDAAGNRSLAHSTPFIIDTTPPTLQVLGIPKDAHLRAWPIVEIRSHDANAQESLPQLALRRLDGQSVELPPLQRITQAIVRLSFEKPRVWLDGRYLLTVTVSDRAGNVQVQQIPFTINQSGATFRMPQALDHAYVSQVPTLRIALYDVSPLVQSTLILIRDNESRILREGEDYDVTTAAADGYTYTYTLKDSLFAKAGIYRLRLLSLDAAGNYSDSFDPSKNASLTFCVDTNAPTIVWLQAQSDVRAGRYIFAIQDDYALASVRFLYDGKEWEAAHQGSHYTLTLPYGKGELQIIATDAAGNQASSTIQTQSMADAVAKAGSVDENAGRKGPILALLVGAAVLLLLGVLVAKGRKTKKS